MGDARAILIRITRKMVSLLNDVTADGYVFRTDLRLRPDPSVTPVCLSMSAAEAYYESVGRTWERAAYIKARAAAGDVEAGEAFLRTMRPFVWRKHLDFAAIQDAHDMRLLIREHKGLGGPLTLPGHNMKLGRGGIREIEFFTQTRQLIAGGRDEGLRHRGTVAGLNALQEAGWVEPDIAEGLQERYVRHRDVEHRLQMVNDQQTHSLPTSDEGFERLAAFMGTGVADLKSRLQSDLEQVHRWTEGFFAPDEAQEQAPVIDDAVVARWPDYPALRSERAAGIFQRLRPEILARLQEAAKPEEALANFDRFLAALPAGVQLFSLFEANPQLTQLMVDICATAPALAEYLSRNAGVFDAVIGGEFFADWPGGAALEQALAAALAAETDYEARLDAARRWQKEWHFRVGVHHLRGLIDAETAGRQYADLARATLRVLWPEVTTQFTTKHGPPPGRGAVVVGMGSLGAARLHAASDLDLIVVYDGAGVDASDGPRSLSTRPYYARMTQALITALTAPMAQGRLYEVDMRLRPSGRQGPVATALTSFQSYQMEEAWTWEHLALTRAEVIAGPDDLGRDVEDIRARVLQAKSGGATVLADVADMRARLAEAKPGAGGLDVKSGAGRLQDVELAAQTIALQAACFERQTEAQIAKGVAVGLVDAADGAALTDAARLWWQVQCTVRLIVGDGDPAAVTGEGGLRFLLRETGVADMAALQKDISTVAAQVAAIISKRLETTDEG